MKIDATGDPSARWRPPFFSARSLAVSLVVFGFFVTWLNFLPYNCRRPNSASCQSDAEGSWSIGVFHGANPLMLKPLEALNLHIDRAAAWPVANPVLTCSSVSNAEYASSFVAEPFLYIQGTTIYLFYETKNAVTHQADIGVAESSDDGTTWRNLGVVLDEPWNLGHPFVFACRDQIYLMPESRNGELRLYRAVDFPMKWTFDRVLINRPLVNAAMVEFNGFFWIFASGFRAGSKNRELEIWYSSSPLDMWMRHKQNFGDKSLGARNAGRPFVYNDELYRPVQDKSGHRIRVFKVQLLTRDRFRETEVAFAFGDSRKGRSAWNGLRQHHLDAQKLPSGKWLAVMDGDKVFSGQASGRFYLGCSSLSVIALLVLASYVLWCYTTGGEKASKLLRLSAPDRNRMYCFRLWLVVFTMVLSSLAIFAAVRCFRAIDVIKPYPVQGVYSQFTLVVMTYDARLWNLKLYVKHYSRCPSVREIVIVWNKGQVPEEDDFDSAVPLRIRVERVNSLNNRFKPDPLIVTRSVLELDDDIILPCDDVERAFRTWREAPERLVGFYPRLVQGKPLKYNARRGNGYNLILTGAAFMDKTVFDLYWSRDMQAGRNIVDRMFNCEDILLNFIVANRTQARTIQYVHPTSVYETAKYSGVGISLSSNHFQKRSACLAKFSALFEGVPIRKWSFNSR